MPAHLQTIDQLRSRAQVVIAHAWMVRAFLRHSDEAEDFPELTEIGRAIFDLARALETRADHHRAYFQMLHKKLPKFKRSVEQFASAAPQISEHINFVQAVVSIRGCVVELQQLLELSREILPATSSMSPESQATDDTPDE
jgi:hypothetical protein